MRRRQQLFDNTDAGLSALRSAFQTLADGRSGGDERSHADVSLQRQRSLVSWDPRYPGEDLNYYQDYVHRHAPIAPPTWLEFPRDNACGSRWYHEATGFGVVRDADGMAEQLVAPLEDGSICMWTAKIDGAGASHGSIQLAHRSRPGLLSGLSGNSDYHHVASYSKTLMTEIGATECVSIDSRQKRGLFAVQQNLQEIDLCTLQVISTQTYPFSITTLSDSQDGIPTVVGTTYTVHQYDPRVAQSQTTDSGDARLELIGGMASTHADLAQPGPLSIVSQKDSIWVAGRFTHLLNYDRRFFPRLRGTIHSGARISCLTASAHPHVPRHLDPSSDPSITMAELQSAKSANGTTLVAGGVYKGKGSLELYGVPATDDGAEGGPPPLPLPLPLSSYRNRQTAATSKLLSVVATGGHLVTSDSDGNVKWFERNAHHRIRSFNINAPPPPPPPPPPPQQQQQQQQQRQWQRTQDARHPDPPHSSSPFSPINQLQTEAQTPDTPGQGDIVQKLAPLHLRPSPDATQNPLFMWTGDGRIGVLGFGGRRNPLTQRRGTGGPDGRGHGDDEDEDDDDEGYVSGCGASGSSGDEERTRAEARRAERRAREDAERQFAGSMRRALEGQAMEVRWMRGLGLGG